MRSDRKPNFVIIYADDLGFGDLGCYGATDLPTPHLDQMAAEGIRFTNSYATAATCTPSRLSLLTGVYPWRNPKAQILAGDDPMLIAPGQRTLQGQLKASGYATGVVGKWHLGLGEGSINWNETVRPSPLDVGFDSAYIMAATNDRVPCVYLDGQSVEGLDPDDPIEVVYGGENPFPEVPTGRDHPELLTQMRHSDQSHCDSIVNGIGRLGFCRGGNAAQWDDETMAEVFLDRAKAFIDHHRNEPFFLYYALHQPHVPRVPGRRFAGTTSHGPRGDVIAELDWCVGQVVAHLKANDLAEDTIVVFSSDNGPVLDDGYADGAKALRGEHRPAGPLRGGKYSMLEGGARVPMLLWAPGRVRPQVSAALFSHVDFLASFAALSGHDEGCHDGLDSQEMSRVLLGEDPVGRESLVTEGIDAKTVVRSGDWVFIPPYPGEAYYTHQGHDSGNDSSPQLYNVEDDPGQEHNRAAEFPTLVANLRQLLRALHQGPDPFSGAVPA